MKYAYTRARKIIFALFIAASTLILLTQCSTSKTAVVEPIEIRVTDTVYVSQENTESVETPPYRATYTRTADLLHTDLMLAFNYAERAVIGKANLTFTPLFYPIDEVVLDAKSFDIKQTAIEGRPVEHTYDGNILRIALDRTYKQGENLKLFIEYKAFPYREEAGGSAAIVSDRGLYFIDPDESDPYKPTQIWTQGQTEASSHWFPTIDKPNERCTQKIRLRVNSEYQTLSNGLLTNSKDNGDGTRTDTWEMTKPHPPYLFMLAVGDFHRTEDTWEKIPIEYYVEHDYAPDAERIFSHTPEMLSYFSTVLDYEYPWDKYSQIIVRDYVSGAMENTTASLFGQFVQHPAADLVDNGNDKIVAHELFHQWFGDLVTCESWSNLTLNEGFANYSEYLWMAHKYGRDEGEQHRWTELQGYLSQAQYYAHPLVDFHYQEKENMFDAHSYNKGGLVLHMLRDLVGDKAFFASLNQYLHDKSFESAEAHDLRLAFEEVTGMDLNWFFNQWFFEPGHPIVELDYNYLPETKILTATINQTQEDIGWPIFRLPTEIEIYTANGMKVKKEIVLDAAENIFHFELPGSPEVVLLDPHKIQLMQINTEVKPSLALYDKASSVWDRLRAIQLLEDQSSTERELLATRAIEDAFWLVRLRTMVAAADLDVVSDRLWEMAKNDAHANVRAQAVQMIEDADQDLINHVLTDRSSRVVAAGVGKLMLADKAAALDWADKHAESTSQVLLQAVAEVFVDQKIKDKTAFFKKSADRMSYDMSFQFYSTWASYLVHNEATAVSTQLEEWKNQLKSDDTGLFRKYAILTGFQPLGQMLPMNSYSGEEKDKIQSLLQEIGMVAASMFGQGG